MDTDGRSFTLPLMKWGLFAIFFCIAPAPVIVFESFMTGPVIFVAASLISLINDAWVSPGTAPVELLAFFAIHLLLYILLYYWAAAAVAKGLGFVADGRIRGGLFVVLVLGAGMTAFLPLYGGAGIHGGSWGPMAFFFARLNESHFGPGAALTIYPPFAFFLAVLLVCVRCRRRRSTVDGTEDRRRSGPPAD